MKVFTQLWQDRVSPLSPSLHVFLYDTAIFIIEPFCALHQSCVVHDTPRADPRTCVARYASNVVLSAEDMLIGVTYVGNNRRLLASRMYATIYGI